MQTQDNTETCYRKGNWKTRQQTSSRPPKYHPSRNDPLANKLEYKDTKKTHQASQAYFGKDLMLPKLQNTLYTLNSCGLCLSTNLLLRYNNGRGEGEETTKEFSLKDE